MKYDGQSGHIAGVFRVCKVSRSIHNQGVKVIRFREVQASMSPDYANGGQGRTDADSTLMGAALTHAPARQMPLSHGQTGLKVVR